MPGQRRSRHLKRVVLLAMAREAVVEDQEILRGTAVFKGTRVPAYERLRPVEAGVTIEEILETYPSLKDRQVILAPVYARAFPPKRPPPTLRQNSLISVEVIRQECIGAADTFLSELATRLEDHLGGTTTHNQEVGSTRLGPRLLSKQAYRGTTRYRAVHCQLPHQEHHGKVASKRSHTWVRWQLTYAADFFRFEAPVPGRRIAIALDGTEYSCWQKPGCRQCLRR
jgi:uncharacterized protein (DUF433 family)